MKLEIGQSYFVKDGNDNWVGELVSIDGPYTISLKSASWVADSGRLSEFIAKGSADNMEIEPVGDLCVTWKALIRWPHRLFTEAV